MLAWIAAGIFIFMLLSIWLLPHYAVNRMTQMKCSTYEGCFDMLEEYKVYSRKQYEALYKEDITIMSHDGLKLCGVYIEQHPQSKRIVILIHGYTAALPWSAQFLPLFSRLGFNALLIDQRRHGNSEGKYTTFGYKEKYDVQAWVDWVVNRKGDDCIIGLHGQSLGGGTVLEYIAIHRPQVRFVVADCPYSDLTKLIRHQVTKLNHMPAWPTMTLVNRLLKRKAGFKMEDVSPIHIIAHSKLPIMFIHGKSDIFVPTYMSEEMFNIKPGPKQLLLIDKATHGVAYCYDQELYEAEVTRFVQQHVGTYAVLSESLANRGEYGELDSYSADNCHTPTPVRHAACSEMAAQAATVSHEDSDNDYDNAPQQ
ncbi:alpha/beta hydrolase [Paenibacillus sp. UMB4589-SE434]|uniref:alpha/beta hydrolase n=1 Tax=Paenibacillus sp. UMB4589-SE434 TaxID=3046314 RepID=UPI00254A704C|nr:alpha/beta hydrolase [Paenibacillus sp. UMB4589-SE434]MDK8182821.1 alpha/beta hydrolase [Paenibacillus sp. UMB4589-SE434]